MAEILFTPVCSNRHKVHKINLLEHFVDDVCERKSLGLRNNTAGYQTGDYIKFTVIDDFGCKKSHPINDKLYLVTYLWRLNDNHIIAGIREDKNDSKKM